MTTIETQQLQAARQSEPIATCNLNRSTKPVRFHAARTGAISILKSAVKELCPQIRYVTSKLLGEPLGAGAFSMVFAHPTDSTKVVKVCWRSPRYLEFLAWRCGNSR